MTINDLYANAMVQLSELTNKYNELVKAANAVREENKKLKEEIETLKGKECSDG